LAIKDENACWLSLERIIKISYGNYIQTKATESCNNGVFFEMEAKRTSSFWDYIPPKG
jgi:hypothetical protein